MCQRCIKSRRECEGYEPRTSNALSRQASPVREFRFISNYSIPFKVPGSQADRQLLHYYCCHAAWSLSSYADPTLWNNLLLQRSQDQPVIRNALVALSALHKDFVLGKLSVSIENKLKPSVETLTMITGCHRQLRNYLSRAEASADIPLICSIVFYAFEALLGDHQRALWHLDQGLSLLKRAQCAACWSSDSPLPLQLTSLYQRLDIQASSYNPRRMPVLSLVSSQEARGITSIVPQSFADLTHAEHVLTKLLNWNLHHHILNVEHKGKTLEDFPSDLLHERITLLQQYQKYAVALTALRSNIIDVTIESSTEKEKREKARQQERRFLLLQIDFHGFYHLVKENIPVHSGGRPPIDNDNLNIALSSMSELLSLIESCEAASSNDTTPLASPCQRTYTLSTNLVAILYYLSMKTTRPSTLAQASVIFSHPLLANTRDGLWDAQSAAFVVKNMVTAREQELQSQENDNMVRTTNSGSLLKDCKAGESQDGIRAPPIADTDDTRLEDFGSGIVDVEGGVDQAAKLLSYLKSRPMVCTPHSNISESCLRTQDPG